MATKVDPPKRKSAPENPGADDLSVLHPDHTFPLAGRSITMREYGFVEGMKLLPLLDPIIAQMRGMIERAEELPTNEQFPAWLGLHMDALVQLMAASADIEPEWIESLSPEDGYELIWFWWVVNGPFCVRNAKRRSQVARSREDALKKLAGQTSTENSSAPATETPPISGE